MKLEQRGAIAQLGERLVCNQKVTGSIPVGSTIPLLSRQRRCNPLPPHDGMPLRQGHPVMRRRPARRLLFNNPEMFFDLTLSFQAKSFYLKLKFENVAFA